MIWLKLKTKTNIFMVFAGLTKFQPHMVSKREDGRFDCTLCGSVYSSAFTARSVNFKREFQK